VSPELRWANVPSGTKSLALQMYDPDAPSGSGFWHWAVYDVPPDTTGLARGVGNNERLLPAGAFGGNTISSIMERPASTAIMAGRVRLPGTHRTVHLHVVRGRGRDGRRGGVVKTGTADSQASC
jgi:phosphatidylethanolamine-binding protein (PEBP) family uncharacterized protein